MRAVASIARRAVGGEGAERRLLRDTVGTIVLNLGTVGLNLALVVILSRSLGAAGYGAFASAIAWGTVLAALAGMGLTPLIVRTTASYRAAESWSLMRGVVRRANEAVAIASTLTVAVAAGLGWLIYRDSELLHPFWIALALVPLIALTSLRQAAMQGLGRVLLGRVPETLVAPTLAIVLVMAVDRLTADSVSATAAAALYAGATLAAFGCGGALLYASLPAEARDTAPAYDMRAWRRSGLALVLLNVVMAANTQLGTILLGAVDSAQGAGQFNVAARTTTFISFTMIAASYPLMPMVARLYSEQAREAMQALVRRAGLMVLLVAAPTGVVLVGFAPQVLRLFGEDFEAGATAVRILAIGEVVNVLTGFGGLVLVMSGYEGHLARGVTCGAAANLLLAATLVPSFGVSGAAVAAATGAVLSNLVLSWYAWRRVGVWAPVVPRPF